MALIGIDGNRPLTPDGRIAAQIRPGVVQETGANFARVNFVVEPGLQSFASPDDAGWIAAYEGVVGGLRDVGVAVYGAIGAEIVPGGHRNLFRGPEDPGGAAEWIEEYVRRFRSIARRFAPQVFAFESVNEPNDWQQDETAWQVGWMHPRWLAHLLARVYDEVKPEAVTLVSGPLLTHDIGGAGDDGLAFLTDTYRAGRSFARWDEIRQATGSFPLDGVGVHLYVCPDANTDADDVRASFRDRLGRLAARIDQLEGSPGSKQMYVSEFGWVSDPSDPDGEARQARKVEAGLAVLREHPRVEAASLFCMQDFDDSMRYGVYPAGALDAVVRRGAFAVFAAAARPSGAVLARPGTTADDSAPKTTRPDAAERRDPQRVLEAGDRMGLKLDALPDRVDARDWLYQPRLAALPDTLVNCDRVPDILDQGREGACTGFALAAVINFLLESQNFRRRVSPRMLYEMARRYDEWPGEQYEGSSARGAMKGWVRHGVCTDEEWPLERQGPQHFTDELGELARLSPGGAFYRVTHRDVRDMHAALVEVGVVFVTLMVHAGWGEPGPTTRTVQYGEPGSRRERVLPVIERRGRADSGHAVAFVGYTSEGFIVQNSWGRSWGAEGFALLPYEDYLLHATDVWVAQLGVPVRTDLWELGAADTTVGFQRASPAIPLSEIRPYVVDVGNNGELSDSGDYWTTRADLERLFGQDIPKATAGWARRRVLVYLHGGLNDETSVARRIVAFRDVLLENQIYPLHVMWESGLRQTLKSMVADLTTDVDDRAGMADWMRRFRDGLYEAKDRSLELTFAAPGGALWREMKENALLSSLHPRGLGAMQLLLEEARKALAPLDAAARADWELHVVGHSAGCIYAAHAVPLLGPLGVTFKTLQFMAPAITTALFKDVYMPQVRAGACPRPAVYILSDVGELDDEVGPYGKSLLYLVSNAFEPERQTPILGMERYLTADPELASLFQLQPGGHPGVVVAGRNGGPGSLSRSNSHGGFDNDPDTLNSVLTRILGTPPRRPFTTRDLQY